MALTLSGGGTITGLNVGGLPDGCVTSADLAAGAVTASNIGTKTFVSYAIICDLKADGVDGGSSVADTWTTRDLNTTIADPDSIVSISSNQFTLQSGTYFIKWYAPAQATSGHKARLYNFTDSTVVQNGQNAHTTTTNNSASIAFGVGRVTIGSSKAFEIQHISNASNGGDGFMSSNAATGDNEEMYTIVEIFKEA